MPETNYLPSIKRANISLGFTRQAPVRSTLDFGGSRTFLCDVAFYALSAGADLNAGPDARVRIGKWGVGLLTEDFYPLCLFNTKPRQEFGVWEFAKPYRLYPGERLSATIEYVIEERGLANRDATVPAVQFNAVRVSDNRPILLYDNFDQRMDTSGSVRLIAEKLQCPSDTPVDIYSCVAQPSTTLTGGLMLTAQYRLMIYGPDGRQWWDNAQWPFMFDPPAFIMDLNKPEWVLNAGESFFCEFITLGTAEPDEMLINLRGHVEVTR